MSDSHATANGHIGAATTPLPWPQQLRRAIITGAVGSASGYYDYAIYGLASALVFNHVFCASFGASGAVLASFASRLGIGFLARPLGGLFFSSLGECKGRKFVLMGIAPPAIGPLSASSPVCPWPLLPSRSRKPA